jgi:hypothetical protein
MKALEARAKDLSARVPNIVKSPIGELAQSTEVRGIGHALR